MEKFSEREMRRQLEPFEEVWRRVERRRSPRETAERCGVPLMPRPPRPAPPPPPPRSPQRGPRVCRRPR